MTLVCPHLGDNHIQNFHLGRYIVDYTVGYLGFRQRVSEAIKSDFRLYIRQYTSPTLNTAVPILMHFLSLVSN